VQVEVPGETKVKDMLVRDSLSAEVLQGCDAYMQFVTTCVQVVSCRCAVCNLHL